MNPEDQRKAIGKACNWERLGEYAYRLPDGRGFHVDILTSLEAAHEWEKTLDPWSRLKYLDELQKIVRVPPNHANDLLMEWQVATATAAQRKDAFLRTRGLWK